MRVRTCPGCGAHVLLDDVTCTVRHPNPICDRFKAMVAKAGLMARHEPWAAVVVPDNGGAGKPN